MSGGGVPPVKVLPVPAEVEKAEEEEDRPLAMMARILIREAMASRKKAGENQKKKERKW